MPQSFGNTSPFTAFLPYNKLFSATTITTSSTTSTNRWTLLVIGGTAIAVIAFGGSAANWSECPCSGSSSYSRGRLESLRFESKSISITKSASIERTETNMLSLLSYLAEKISSFFSWRSASLVLENANGDRRRGIGGVELGERVKNKDEEAEKDEVDKLKKLLEEAKTKEGEGTKAKEEVDRLRDEVELLKKELEEERKKQKAGEEKRNGGRKIDVVDPYSVVQDTVSEGEVISLLEALNTEIMEVAHTVTRAFANTGRPALSEDTAEELKEAVLGATEILGLSMVELLQAPQRSGACGGEDTVKMALQASMTAYMHWIISSWYFENPEDEHLLSEIYARVRETEDQTVSGRWRALTRVHLQRMLAEEPDLTIYMVDAFVNIILTAGWHNDAAALQEYLIATFGHKIGGVLEKAKKLNKVIGEEIVRCDLEALYIAPDVIYNEMTMEAVGDEGVEVEETCEKRVLCTTKLGLVKAEKRSRKIGEWDEAVLLKPRVILQPSVVGGE